MVLGRLDGEGNWNRAQAVVDERRLASCVCLSGSLLVGEGASASQNLSRMGGERGPEGLPLPHHHHRPATSACAVQDPGEANWPTFYLEAFLIGPAVVAAVSPAHRAARRGCLSCICVANGEALPELPVLQSLLFKARSRCARPRQAVQRLRLAPRDVVGCSRGSARSRALVPSPARISKISRHIDSVRHSRTSLLLCYGPRRDAHVFWHPLQGAIRRLQARVDRVPNRLIDSTACWYPEDTRSDTAIIARRTLPDRR